MKINQWTLGLAAVGVVSLASAVNAEEAKMNALQTALSATTISGYVDTSVEWNDNDYVAGVIPFRSAGKENGFNLNVVKLSLEKAMDESEWASGYKVDLLFGPDAIAYNPSNGGDNTTDFAIKQAYVALRTPIGNGIDWKVGVFDSILGYETFEAGNNPNFTRSWAYAIEPTQLTGALATYRISDIIAIAGGVANKETAGINGGDADGNGDANWDKSWTGSIAITAPDDAGFLSGSTLYGGVILGSSLDQDNYYVGGTINTPVAGLKAGVAFDLAQDVGGVDGVDAQTIGAYLSFQASEKLSLHARGEIGSFDAGSAVGAATFAADTDVLSLTGTVQYDLWANVVSRLEVRWDDVENNPETIGIYANMIYKF